MSIKKSILLGTTALTCLGFAGTIATPTVGQAIIINNSGSQGMMPNETIVGNGQIETTTRTVGQFHSLTVSEGIQAVLTDQDQETGTVQTDQNLQSRVKVENQNGAVSVYLDRSDGKLIRPSQPIRVFLAASEIQNLKASSSATITAEKVHSSGSLEIKATAASSMNLGQVQAKQVDVTSSSASRAQINQLQAPQVNLKSSSASQVQVNQLQTDDLVATATSASGINLQQAAAVIAHGQLTARTASQVQAGQVPIADLSVQATVGSRVIANAQQELQIQAKNASKVEYTGPAQVTQQRVTRGAQVNHF
ncbi:DUF2807 domain-containing protein [Lactobacillus sp. DCY120]|uniref:DUF2807 domain-containing protein n=1 Tax=Bombilactobacillus apium TaxID=2675299 RepID=A0A850R729_9LACO|nr:DUF2807 domain-containing protein [Bombilactobacillus apium]NVY96452.1 DUF2807 domain-containing protein [Bombilactobacillus apium]